MAGHPGQALAIREYPYLVGGDWRTSDERLEVLYPYTGAPAGITFRPTASDVEEAVRRAEGGFEATRSLPAYERHRILAQVRQELDERREEMATLISLEGGRTYAGSLEEIDRARDVLEVAMEEARRINGEVLPLDWNLKGRDRMAIVRRFPIGPILAISPFNRPLNLVVHKLAPALAAGNPVLLKPASKTPLTALVLGEIILKAGWPPEALSVLPLSTTLAESLVADERVKMLTFTGSAAVGWHLHGLAVKKRVTLELGGNAGVIVDGDADWEHAARRIALGAFYYAGQACISVQRVYVHADIAAPFQAELVRQAEKLRLGDPFDQATDIGPMISEAEAQRVEQWVDEAVRHGARVLTGGRREGPFYHPTLLSDTEPSMRVSCDEIFGPVATVEPFQDFEEALRLVNGTRYGLQAAIFSRSLDHVFRAFEVLEVGGLIVNEMSAFRAEHMPYGGLKDSGLGREGPRYAIEEMTERKVLVLSSS